MYRLQPSLPYPSEADGPLRRAPPRAAPTVATRTYLEHYLKTPYAKWKKRASRPHRALQLPSRHSPKADRAAFDWAVQHATAINRTARQYAFDFDVPAQLAASLPYRDGRWRPTWSGDSGTREPRCCCRYTDAHAAHRTPAPPGAPSTPPGSDGALHGRTLGPAGPAVSSTLWTGCGTGTPDPPSPRHHVTTSPRRGCRTSHERRRGSAFHARHGARQGVSDNHGPPRPRPTPGRFTRRDDYLAHLAPGEGGDDGVSGPPCFHHVMEVLT